MRAGMHWPFPPPPHRRRAGCRFPSPSDLTRGCHDSGVSIPTLPEATGSLPFPRPYPWVSHQQPGRQPLRHSRTAAEEQTGCYGSAEAGSPVGPAGLSPPPRDDGEEQGVYTPAQPRGPRRFPPPSKTAPFPFAAVIQSLEKEHLGPRLCVPGCTRAYGHEHVGGAAEGHPSKPGGKSPARLLLRRKGRVMPWGDLEEVRESVPARPRRNGSGQRASPWGTSLHRPGKPCRRATKMKNQRT